MRPTNPCSVCGEDFEPVKLAGIPLKQCMRCFGKFLTRFDPLAYELNERFGEEPPDDATYIAARIHRFRPSDAQKALLQ